MEKALKRAYSVLDLPYSASEEEVKLKHKILTKFYRAKAIKTGKNEEVKLKEIHSSYDLIIDNLKTNGMPLNHNFRLDISFDVIKTLLTILISIFIIGLIIFFSMI